MVANAAASASSNDDHDDGGEHNTREDSNRGHDKSAEAALAWSQLQGKDASKTDHIKIDEI